MTYAEWVRAFRRCSAWRALSRAVRSEASVCARCGRPVTYETCDADHRIPLAQRPDLCLDPRNVRALCVACNRWLGSHTPPYSGAPLPSLGHEPERDAPAVRPPGR